MWCLKFSVICSLLLATVRVSSSLRIGMKPTMKVSNGAVSKVVASFGLASSLLGGAFNANAAAVPSSSTSFAQAKATTLQIAAGDPIPALGSAAPDFSLPSNTGKTISLSDLKGSRTVLYFYPGDFTSGCTIEAQAFQRDVPKYKELDTKIVGVSVDSVEKHLDFSKSYGLDFPLLSDQGGKVSGQYGTLLDIPFMGKFSNRQTYIISPDGKVEYIFTDVESRLAKHSNEVLAKLVELKK